MNARIDVVTPSGKSLEGFPYTTKEECYEYTSNILDECASLFYQSHLEYLNAPLMTHNHKLAKGDRIIIEIL